MPCDGTCAVPTESVAALSCTDVRAAPCHICGLVPFYTIHSQFTRSKGAASTLLHFEIRILAAYRHNVSLTTTYVCEVDPSPLLFDPIQFRMAIILGPFPPHLCGLSICVCARVCMCARACVTVFVRVRAHTPPQCVWWICGVNSKPHSLHL